MTSRNRVACGSPLVNAVVSRVRVAPVRSRRGWALGNTAVAGAVVKWMGAALIAAPAASLPETVMVMAVFAGSELDGVNETAVLPSSHCGAPRATAGAADTDTDDGFTGPENAMAIGA